MKNGKFILLYYNVDKMGRKQAVGGMFGFVGAAIVASSLSKDASDNVCYIVTPGEKKALIINDKRMKEFMSDKPDILKKYMSLEKQVDRMNSEHVLPLLKEAGWF